ncbi:MAG: ABC transporter permease subunit [Polyangiaceae bacterium]|nr:ABC transporter permease subunit [Polyangiaceae bacterium]
METLRFLLDNRTDLAKLCLEHVRLVFFATLAATLVGVPTGILLTRKRWLARPVLALANIAQTIPSLALFGFLIPVLGAYGIGALPAVIALFLYALLPILRNTHSGIDGVNPSVREAARAMGMTDWQQLRLVELPLAVPIVLAGIRVAVVISIGTATIAAAIGAGGLGTWIFRGLRMSDDRLILAGAIPAAAMALLADQALGGVERSFKRPRRQLAKAAATIAAVMVALAIAVFAGAPKPATSGTVTVGSKDFTEQVILGELVAQILERDTGLHVERRFELGGDLCHRGVVAGNLDVYVEYTGTAFTTVLKHPPISDPAVVYRAVAEEYQSRWNLVWLPPLGFDNTFAILVRGADARRLGLRTISDVLPLAPQWRAGFGQDFVSREDGYPGFTRAYGLRFAGPPSEMDLSLTYRALATGQVDLIAGNATDGLIDKLGLVQLQDDRRYFPPYEAAMVVRGELLERSPEVRTALARLSGRLTSEHMRRLNDACDGEHRSPAAVAKEFLDNL